MGKKELFKGLYLENNYDFSESYPVIKISFGAGNYDNEGELDATIKRVLDNYATQYNLTLTTQFMAIDLMN